MKHVYISFTITAPIVNEYNIHNNKSVALVRELTIPTERLPLVSEVSATCSA
jgi:hypothetical protein